MSILSKVTRNSLVKNRTRTIVTIIGIILSAAMITAVTVSITSLLSYLQNVSIFNDGNWHVALFAVGSKGAEAVADEDQVDSAALAQEIGYAPYENDNLGKPYVYIMGADSLFFERMPVRLTEGRLPQNASEVILPEHLFSFGGKRPALGDTVTLSLGERVIEGETLGQHNPLVRNENEDDAPTAAAEEFRPLETRTYTVVGYYGRPSFENYSAPGYTVLTAFDASEERPVDMYLLLKKPKDFMDFISGHKDLAEGGSDYNTDLLMFSGTSAYDTFFTTLFGMAAILIGLIMFGSVSLIYNAFSISVADRTKQFGLLSSIGATRRQLRRMVFTEAVYVSAIGIPLGILSGIAGMGVTFHFIGDKFASVMNFSVFDETAVNVPTLRLAATWPAVLIALTVAFITVLISAWVPSRRAAKVSAIEAIRQSVDVSVKPREVKTSRLTYKLFKLEGAIASKHFKRSRKGYRATVVSLFMSVVLFIAASSFCTYLTDSVSGVFEGYDYDISGSWGSEATDRNGTPVTVDDVLAALSSVPGVTNASSAKYVTSDCYIDWDDLTPKAQEAFSYFAPGAGTEDGKPTYTVRLYGVDDGSFRRYLRERRLSESDFFDASNPRAVVMSELSAFNSHEGRQERVTMLREDVTSITVHALSDYLYEEWREREYETGEEAQAAYEACHVDMELSIGAHVEELPFGLNSASVYEIQAVYPLSVFEAAFGGVYVPNHIPNRVYFKTENHEAGYEALLKAAKDAGFDFLDLMDVYAMNETEMDLVLIIKVFSYGFITLISLIALANVFNTISTNIFLRRREFAMLKSVGMTRGGFNRMMNFECILYGVKSLMYGLPVAIGLTYLMYLSVNASYETKFYMPWVPVAIAVGSVFLVVFATMMYAMGRIRHDNPIDALKSENL